VSQKSHTIYGRDINASINILAKGREGHSRTNASGDATSTIQKASQIASMNQEHTLQPRIAEEAHTLEVGGCHN
jgi:transposase